MLQAIKCTRKFYKKCGENYKFMIGESYKILNLKKNYNN